MTHTKRLRDQILRNRQRLRVPTFNEDVRHTLGRDIDVADAVLSNDLDISVRRLLANRRPSENGTLIVTESYQHFEREVRSYFAMRSDVTFYALLAHTLDVGALILRGS